MKSHQNLDGKVISFLFELELTQTDMVLFQQYQLSVYFLSIRFVEFLQLAAVLFFSKLDLIMAQFILLGKHKFKKQ